MPQSVKRMTTLTLCLYLWLWVQSFGIIHSNSDDDLSNLCVGFHVAVRIDNLREPKSSADDWFEGPVGKMPEDILLGLQKFVRKFIGIRDNFEETVTLDSQVFPKSIRKRIRGGFIGQHAIFENDPASSNCSCQRKQSFTSDGIEDNARTFAAGDRTHPFAQIFFISHYDVTSSKSEKLRLLGMSARRSDADCTLEFGDFNSGDAD